MEVFIEAREIRNNDPQLLEGVLDIIKEPILPDQSQANIDIAIGKVNARKNPQKNYRTFKHIHRHDEGLSCITEEI